MRLHPITQLMLLAALLIFAGETLWLYGLGRFALTADAHVLDLPLFDRAGIFAGGEGPAIKRLAYGVGTLVSAFWIEALARVLAHLRQCNQSKAGA